MKLTKVLSSFTVFTSVYCMFHLVSSSYFTPPSSLSSMCPVMHLTTNLSSSFLLVPLLFPSASPLFLLCIFSFPLSLLHYSPLPPPFLPPDCVASHAVNNKARQVVAVDQVDSHGTLSLRLGPALAQIHAETASTHRLSPPLYLYHFNTTKREQGSWIPHIRTQSPFAPSGM